MKKLELDRIVGKRPDNKNEYLQIKPEHPDNLDKLPANKKSIKTAPNVKQGKWRF
jgi:exoribonuclease II